MAEKAKRVTPFKETVQNLFIVGILLMLLGFGAMVGAWPETSVYSSSFMDEPIVSESGSEAWVFIGAAAAGVGQICVAIAIIACGVRIGTRDRVATPVP